MDSLTSLLGSLRRRKVFRVAAGYIIASWLLLQVADIVFPALQLPEWTLTLLTALLGFGFAIALVLAWAFEITPEGIMRDADSRNLPESTRSQSVTSLIYIILALVLIMVGLEVSDRFAGNRHDALGNAAEGMPNAVVRRTRVELGNMDRMPVTNTYSMVAVDPTGSRIVYTTYRDGGNKLYLRELDELDPELIAEVPDAPNVAFWSPAFSPDGDRLVFQDINTSQIKTLVIREKQIRPIAAIGHLSTSFFWTDDEHIVFTAGAGILSRIPASGGAVEPLGIPKEEPGHIQSWAQYLPDGETLLYTTGHGDSFADGVVSLFFPATGETRKLIENAFAARYVNSGHIVFMRSGAIWAVPFDIEQSEIAGLEAPVISRVESSTVFAKASYAVSDRGFLVYVPGFLPKRGGDALAWVDMEGNEELLDLDRATYLHPQASPAGQKISVIRSSTRHEHLVGGDLWVHDPIRRTFVRLTSGSTTLRPIWAPDGQHLVYQDITRLGLWMTTVDGTGEPFAISRSIVDQRPESWSPDGNSIVYRDYSSTTFDLFRLANIDDDEWREEPLIQTDDVWEAFSDVSSDGKWIAYTSNETGSFEVYVRPFPNVDDGKWQVSSGGGEEPRWSPKGDELFYRDTTGNSFMSVSVDTSADFEAGIPRVRVTGDYAGFGNRPSYDISADGERLLVLKLTEADEPSEPVSLVFVDNWFLDLKAMAPGSR